ncbi:MAG TPA: phenylacetate--CoA ligase family protein [Acidobacteriota bacterium]|nr:phenylacetate--CoA ligase family protein [Acidobacteriota bacterium]
MDLPGTLARHVFIPAYNRRWGIRNGPIIRNLMRSQYFTPEQIRADQWQAVKRLLDFVYAHNTFYRRRFDAAGMTPDDVTSREEFARLPALTKDDIRQNSELLISRGYSREQMTHKRTGGSTGLPVHLYVDAEAFSFKYAVTYRHDRWAGYLPGARRAALWGDTDKKYSLKERLYKALCERTLYMDTLKMDDEYLLAFVRKLRRYRPHSLIGHAHSLYFFAKFLRDNAITDVCFDSIVSTAETLSAEERQTVEAVFGRIVFDRYGCEELSLIASECEQHDGLHISAEGLYVEIIGGDDTRPGDLVITDLVNRGMPFIRYEIGDTATTLGGACACGRGLPRLGRVSGRTADILYTPEGRKISGISILDTFVIHIPGLRQVQIVQEKPDQVTFKIVKDADFGQHTLEKLARTVSGVFGPAMKYDIEYVTQIPMTPRGKYQFSVSRLKEEDLP